MSIKIKDLAECEQPYQKAISKGINTLSDAELVAIILRNGNRDQSAIDISNTIFNLPLVNKGLIGLNYLTREELLKVPGIGDTKATQLLAIPEIAKRMNVDIARNNLQINSSAKLAAYYIEKCRFLTREKAFVLLLSSGNQLIKELQISEGTINQTALNPREVFALALKYDAVSIVLVHNHTSGLVEPSNTDLETTEQLVNAGKLLGIKVLDHLIVSNNNYFSMFERGIIQ